MQPGLPFPSPAPGARVPDTLIAGRRLLVCRFVRNARARHYIVCVEANGTARVTIPRGGSKREAEAFARRQIDWIDRQRHLHATRPSRPTAWTDGDAILLRGEPVRLAVEGDGPGRLVRFGDQVLPLAPAADDLRPAIERHLRRLAAGELPPRLLELAARHGLQPGAIRIRSQRSRWGSCSRSRTICLNWRLVQMPPAVRDYVLLHELMHLRQPNHSRRFWHLVERACPDHHAARAWLRTHGEHL